ncbi:Endogenous Retrovirus Group K Member 5 Gag Polyprotein [Manis pentadactyla]|nr:Endogenous Retrovirus Group K Member 5 Gag Polyprotein [Manis pentadactyla]
MSHGESKERGLFIEIIKQMIEKRGIKVSSEQLNKFLHFVQECCAWFPKDGSVDMEIWDKVSEGMLVYYYHGPEKVPTNAFALWNLIKEVLELKQHIEAPPRFDQKTPTAVRTTLKQAELEGDTEFMCYAIIFGGEFDDESVSWEPIPYKLLRELKIACNDYDPLTPYPLTLLEALSNRWMTPLLSVTKSPVMLASAFPYDERLTPEKEENFGETAAQYNRFRIGILLLMEDSSHMEII